MIIIYDGNDNAYFIRPTPLVSITWSSTTDASGPIGGKYDIVFSSSLINDAGSPIFTYDNKDNPSNGISWARSYNPRPAEPPLSASGALGSILSKQIALRELFAKKCVKIEICSIEGGEPIITFYPKLISMNFEEETWTTLCKYTINLEASFLLDKNDNIIGAESYSSEPIPPGASGIEEFLKKKGGMVEDVQETWSLEPEDGIGNTLDPGQYENMVRVYRLTRNISAKGSDMSSFMKCFSKDSDKTKYLPHNQAKNFVMNRIGVSGAFGSSNTYDDYPSLVTYFGSGLLNLDSTFYTGYNHARTENIDVNQGTYSLQDSWILSSGNAHENYNLSLSTGEGEALTTVTIDGTIKGLTSIPASGSIFGGNHQSIYNTAYENAINKYRQITNQGQFGINAWTFKRAQNAAGGYVSLNDKPLSISLGTNEFTGEITYNIQYDDRAKNTISGVSFEGITVTDTYPGDAFAVIPVIGRPTGPILQYIGGRTEYKRNLSIELVMEIPSGMKANGRQALLKKPSLLPATNSGIKQAIADYSPGKEPGIRKYFIDPPVETWSPKDGRYTLDINWTYELDH